MMMRGWVFASMQRLFKGRGRFYLQQAGLSNLLVLPRRDGIMVGVALLGVFTISLRIENNLLLLLAVVLAVLFLSSVVWSVRNITGIQVALEPGQHLIAGKLQEVFIILRARRPRHHLFIVNDDCRIDLDLAREVARLPIMVRCDKRGWQQVPSFKIESDFPFGIIRSCCCLSAGMILVVPQPKFGYEQLFLDKRKTHNSTSPDEGNLVDSVEEWRMGMTLSRINWKKFAATRRLLVKTGENTPQHRLRIDYARVKHHGHENALSIMCGAVLNAMQQREAFEILLPEQHMHIAEGHGGKALEALAEVKEDALFL